VVGLLPESIREDPFHPSDPCSKLVWCPVWHPGSVCGEPNDLAETLRIATRGEMNLHLADYHLESARLHLAQADRDPGSSDADPDRGDSRSAHLAKAREHWATAKEMIDRMGYHRRDRELDEIETQLAQSVTSRPS
jgi:hypothetical protein